MDIDVLAKDILSNRKIKRLTPTTLEVGDYCISFTPQSIVAEGKNGKGVYYAAPIDEGYNSFKSIFDSVFWRGVLIGYFNTTLYKFEESIMEGSIDVLPDEPLLYDKCFYVNVPKRDCFRFEGLFDKIFSLKKKHIHRVNVKPFYKCLHLLFDKKYHATFYYCKGFAMLYFGGEDGNCFRFVKEI